MKTPRKPVARFSGKGVCRWCGEKVAPPRRSWCGPACVDAYLEGDPTRFRSLVLERDKGVCAGCGRDCLALETALNERLGLAYRGELPERLRAVRWRKFLLRLRPSLVTGFHLQTSLWQADHVVPLSEGGANNPSNGRTLCLMCHRSETAAGAARRAAARREAKQPDLFSTQ